MNCPFRRCPDLKCRIARALQALVQKKKDCAQGFERCPIFRGRVTTSLDRLAWPVRFAG